MVKPRIFIDTSALVAYLRQTDSCHKRAEKIWEALKLQKTTFIISNYIFAEFLTVIRQRLGIKAGTMAGNQIKKGNIFKVMWIDRELEEKAWEIFRKSKIKNLSFIDCTSMACMQKLGIKQIFSFDKHFQKQEWKVIN